MEFSHLTEELSNNNWFRRVWAIQEVVYSRETFVRHSNVRVSWRSMMNLVSVGSLARVARRRKTGELQPRFKNGNVVRKGMFFAVDGSRQRDAFPLDLRTCSSALVGSEA